MRGLKRLLPRRVVEGHLDARAGRYPSPGFDKAMARVKADKSWRVYEVPCGHDVMVDMPERLLEILLEVA